MSTPPQAKHLNPPQQSRSQRTLERIVAASLELLATQGPSGLTVQAVVDKADSSVGSFYARFKGKDDLFADESHFTAEGHRLAAALILDGIRPLVVPDS